MSVKSGDKRPTKSGAGMTAKGVAKYRRQNPCSKLQTAVTEKKPTGKRAARRKSFCARSAGQMKKFPKAAKDPNSRLRQARKRWRCLLAYLQSNVPYFKCWVRKEYTHNHEKYHGEFIHAMAIAVTTMPTRCLSFQVIFTGAETYDEEDEPNVHGGAMWARMPITALVGDTPLEDWPEPMPVWAAQPWDCSSRDHAVYVLDRATPCPWLAKIDGEMYPAKYMFTVDYTNNEIADDPAQHKQSHVMELLDAGEWTGNIVALPNNRVRVTHPAWFETGEGAPDFRPSQHIHYSKSDLDYTLDVNQVFDNLYAEKDDG